MQSPNKEAILGILDELDTMYGAISNDPDPEVSEDHLSTLSDLVERLGSALSLRNLTSPH